MVNRLLVDRPSAFEILEPFERLVHDRAMLHDHQAAADNPRITHALLIERGDARPRIAGLAGNGPGEEEECEGARHAVFVPQCRDGIKSRRSPLH